MTVVGVDKDPTQLTMTFTSEFDVSLDRVWLLWADPRQLERWWGPPSFPSTVVDHDLVPGGRVSYFMTGTEGEKYHGWWQVISVEPPQRLEFEDGFSDDDGEPDYSLGTTVSTILLGASADGGTTMTIKSAFPSAEVMEQMLAMGAEEGLVESLGQIDAIFAEGD